MQKKKKKKSFSPLKFRPALGLTHHSTMAFVLAPESGRPRSSLPRFNVLSDLTVPISRNTNILYCFPTINYHILSHVGAKGGYYLRINLLFQTTASGVICLFLVYESRYSASHSTYRMYIQCGWGSPSLHDVVPAIAANADQNAPTSRPACHVDLEKLNRLGFHNFSFHSTQF